MKAIKIGFAALMLLTIGTACHSTTKDSSNTTDTLTAPSAAAMPDSNGNNATVGGSGAGAAMTDTTRADTSMHR